MTRLRAGSEKATLHCTKAPEKYFAELEGCASSGIKDVTFARGLSEACCF